MPCFQPSAARVSACTTSKYLLMMAMNMFRMRMKTTMLNLQGHAQLHSATASARQCLASQPPRMPQPTDRDRSRSRSHSHPEEDEGNLGPGQCQVLVVEVAQREAAECGHRRCKVVEIPQLGAEDEVALQKRTRATRSARAAGEIATGLRVATQLAVVAAPGAVTERPRGMHRGVP